MTDLNTFRDIEFDLEKDQEQCRYGLPEDMEELESRRRSNVAVKRVTEIFENPVFFGPDGPNASAVRQGQLGDCWFLAALSAIATVDSGALLKKLCVAVSLLPRKFILFLNNRNRSATKKLVSMASFSSATATGNL